MSYRGTMEGWGIDDNECHGHCGLCEECETQYYENCDEKYDSYENEDNFT